MDGQRMVILSGGELSDAELAAITVALELHGTATDASQQPMSRWARAARLEACGHPPIDQPTRFPR